MKPQHFAVLAGSLLVMALILLVAERPAPGKDQAAKAPPRTVTVMGEGEVRARPDQVTLTFGISTWTHGASAAEAEALNLASVMKLTESIQQAGVDAEAIATERPKVTPLTRQDYAGKTYLTGFESVSRVTVTVTDLDRADAVIAAGLANGATSLESAVYGLANPAETRQKALQAAIDNAREQAAAIVTHQDKNLGDLLAVEVLEEEAPAAQAGSTPGALRFKVRVKATYQF